MQTKQEHNKDELMLYWDSFLSGNEDALAKIYEKLIQDLYSFGTTLTPDDELVKDCIQDVFVWVLQKKSQLASVRNIRVYLLNALKNALLNTFKRQQVYRKFMDSYGDEEPADESEEERIIAEEDDRALQNLTEKYKSALTKRQQEIIHYRFVDELAIEEIAKLLNVNYQTIANTIQRSLNKIRKIYLKGSIT